MTEQHDSMAAVVAKTIGVIAAWAGTITLSQVQAVVAICSGIVVGGYAATQWYVLWRDKIKGKKHAND
jgi:hypothetical protein